MSIWFGHRSSVCQLIIERLDGTYEERNEQGQYPLYNKVAGVVVTGNEDGAHACAEATLFNLTHLGCTVPPNADTYWVGEAGPGPSYLEAGGAVLHVPGAEEVGDLRAGGGRRHGVGWSPRSSRWMLGDWVRASQFSVALWDTCTQRERRDHRWQ